MTDEKAAGTPARYIDLALVAVACLILLGAHFFGGEGANRPTSPTGVDWDTVAPARPDTSGARAGRRRLEIPDPIDRARSLLTGVRDADLVKSDLRNVVIVQEVFFSENSTYATGIEQLLPFGLRLRSGATVRIVHGSETGWAASAAWPDAPDLSCVVHIGRQPSDTTPLTFRDRKRAPEGAPVCDGDR